MDALLTDKAERLAREIATQATTTILREAYFVGTE